MSPSSFVFASSYSKRYHLQNMSTAHGERAIAAGMAASLCCVGGIPYGVSLYEFRLCWLAAGYVLTNIIMATKWTMMMISNSKTRTKRRRGRRWRRNYGHADVDWGSRESSCSAHVWRLYEQRPWVIAVVPITLEQQKYRLKNYLLYLKDDETGGDSAKELIQESYGVLKSSLIDNLFPTNTTVMFREPSQVFTLIDSMLECFPSVASRIGFVSPVSDFGSIFVFDGHLETPMGNWIGISSPRHHCEEIDTGL
jgi:hypothetical protein